LTNGKIVLYNSSVIYFKGSFIKMKRIKTIETKDLAKSAANGGCGECQTSCQSACKTSCGVANQPCEKKA
jgi:predicted ribosomally synthesized six-cysteine peptide SCIFF